MGKVAIVINVEETLERPFASPRSLSAQMRINLCGSAFLRNRDDSHFLPTLQRIANRGRTCLPPSFGTIHK